jgi:serine/threonine protein kinase
VDLDLARLACDLYWAVYQLHEARVVHCDIKPANVVRMVDGQHRLVDFDRALDLNCGRERTVWTEGFDHHDDVIVQERPEDFDLEGVFWTVVYLWALKRQQQQHGKPSQRVHHWHLVRGELAVKARKGCPEAHALVAELGDVALYRLRHPRDVMQRLLGLRATGDSADSWLSKARQEEARLGTLPCSELLLRRMFNTPHVQ